MKPLPQPTAWYKTKLGLTFVIILSLAAVGLLWFFGTVAYYAWQISRGEGDALDAQFNEPLISTDGTLATGTGRPLDSVDSIMTPLTPIKGSQNAPITIVAFIDFECPFCQASFIPFEQMLETYSPVVRVIFKHFPLASIHPLAVQAGEASMCAHEQGAFWPYYKILFEKRVFSPNALKQYAGDLQLDPQNFSRCMESDQYLSLLERDFADGLELGVRGTPTYFVNGKKIEGVISRAQWDTLILTELEQNQ